jgi:LPXTG-motif cell wall-anchored protein
VTVKTDVTPNDATANTPGALAFTGGSSTPLLVLGIILLLAGATVSAVSWQRRRTA